jgi:hypothetical protein
MRLLIAATCCLVLSTPAFARPVRVWTYDDLLKEADVVAIVKVTKVAETDVPLAGHGDPKQYQGKRADAIVGLMLKGEGRPSLAFDVFRYAPDTSSPPNGALFADVSKADTAHYLVFLKRQDDGTLVPVSGHYDAQVSIREMSAQGLIEIKEKAK